LPITPEQYEEIPELPARLAGMCAEILIRFYLADRIA
jgi:hypothetical protein